MERPPKPEKKYKECRHCGHKTRNLSWSAKAGKYNHYTECQPCIDFKTRYGFKLTKSDRKLLNSRPWCQICESLDDLHIDHNHKTNEIRGYLCGACNRGLGLFRENIQNLTAAIRYIS